MEKKLKLKQLSLLIDCSRNGVMKPNKVKEMISYIEKMGYTSLMLYMEDVYEMDNQPYFGHRRGRYTKAELKEIDAYAKEHNIEIIPCIETLGHLERIMCWPQYSQICDMGNVLLVDDEKTYELIEEMFKTMAECFSTKTIHVGMDETHYLGRGKHIDKYGYEPPSALYLRHLNRLSEIARKYGFQLIMWHDMFYKLFAGSTADPNIKIPDNVQVSSFYYSSTSKKLYNMQTEDNKKIGNYCWFATAVWTFTGHVPHLSYSYDVCKAAIESCIENNIENVIVCVWGDGGNQCSRFATLPILYAASCFAKGVNDEKIIKDGFKEMFGIDYDDFMLIELPETENQTPIDHIYWPVCAADKYMLYNDCFMGLYDCTVAGGEGEKYAKAAQKIRDAKITGEYAVLFDTIATLADIIAVKYEIGVKTREAYFSKDKSTLSKILLEYDYLLEKIEDFYLLFEKQWHIENKPQGFEFHDALIGGLIQRIKHCKMRMIAYLNDEIDSIPELEEPVLDIKGGGAPLKKPVCS